MSSRKVRRAGVILNYLSLFCIFIIFNFGDQGGMIHFHIDWTLVSCFVGICMITFYFVHKRTGFYKLIHTKVKKLDEREVQLTHNAFRSSYFIFSSLMFMAILFFILFYESSKAIMFDMDYLMSRIVYNYFILWYISITLPSSLIAWKEREV